MSTLGHRIININDIPHISNQACSTSCANVAEISLRLDDLNRELGRWVDIITGYISLPRKQNTRYSCVVIMIITTQSYNINENQLGFRRKHSTAISLEYYDVIDIQNSAFTNIRRFVKIRFYFAKKGQFLTFLNYYIVVSFVVLNSIERPNLSPLSHRTSI